MGVSNIIGELRDASTRQPIADVVVTATSPNLQGEQVVVSDATGTYRVPQLPPGTYTLRFEKETYRPFTRTGITLTVDKTIRLNAELLPETVEQGETITVVGRAPTIDVGSSSTGVTIGQDFMRTIPVARPGGVGGPARSFEALALNAPQTQSDAYGVGINGASSPENGFYVDGVVVNNSAYGINGSPTNIEFIDQVNVITGGYLPEFGRNTGGILNAVTKSGTNEFHGSVFANFSPGGWAGRPNTVRSDASSVTMTARPWNLGDFGATLGGPIVKDKLWFFVGLQPSTQISSVTRRVRQFQFERDGGGNVVTQIDPLLGPVPVVATDADGRPISDEITSMRQGYTAALQQLQYMAKVTWAINDNHRVNLSFRGAPTQSGGPESINFNLSSPVPGSPGGENLSVGDFGSSNAAVVNIPHDLVAQLNSSFNDKKMLLDVMFGWHNEYNARLPVDGSDIASGRGLSAVAQAIYTRSLPTHYLNDFLPLDAAARARCEADGFPEFACPAQVWLGGGPGYIFKMQQNAYNARAVGTWFLNALGHHTIKAGIEGYFATFRHTRAYSGGAILVETPDGFGFQVPKNIGYLDGPNETVNLDSLTTNSRTTTLGGFVQDSWSIFDKVTANIGLRYDQQVLFGTDGKVAVNLPHQWSPRVGAVYDFTQQGRSKLYANYSIYYQNLATDLIDRAVASEPTLGMIAAAAPGVFDPTAPGCDPRVDSVATCLDPRNRLPFAPILSPNILPFTAQPLGIARNLRPNSTGEVVAGFEYEVFANARASVNYTRRNVLSWIDDVSPDGGNTYSLVNPGYGVASSFPKVRRDYDALTLTFVKAFADNWHTQLSYTFSSLRGNISGLFVPESLQLDPGINTTFDSRSLLVNQNGPLPGDNRHFFKLYGAKDFILSGSVSITLGLAYEGRSGSPLNYLGANFAPPGAGAGQIFILPRGSAGRLPWIHTFDGRLGINFRVGKDSMLQANMDVFNLFNFQGITDRDQNYTLAGVEPIPNGTVAQLPQDVALDDGSGATLSAAQLNRNFGRPRAYQPVRTFRFGLKLLF